MKQINTEQQKNRFRERASEMSGASRVIQNLRSSFPLTVCLCAVSSFMVGCSTLEEKTVAEADDARALMLQRMYNDMRYSTDDYFGDHRDLWYADANGDSGLNSNPTQPPPVTCPT